VPCYRAHTREIDIAETQAWGDHRHHQGASRPRLVEWGHRRPVEHFLLLLREAPEVLAAPGVLRRHGCNSNNRRNKEVTATWMCAMCMRVCGVSSPPAPCLCA
jgi:hypothetical protein